MLILLFSNFSVFLGLSPSLSEFVCMYACMHVCVCVCVLSRQTSVSVYRDKTFVATKMILVASPANDSAPGACQRYSEINFVFVFVASSYVRVGNQSLKVSSGSLYFKHKAASSSGLFSSFFAGT